MERTPSSLTNSLHPPSHRSATLNLSHQQFYSHLKPISSICYIPHNFPSISMDCFLVTIRLFSFIHFVTRNKSGTSMHLIVVWFVTNVLNQVWQYDEFSRALALAVYTGLNHRCDKRSHQNKKRKKTRFMYFKKKT